MCRTERESPTAVEADSTSDGGTKGRSNPALALLAHELRTPLAAIMGWARILAGGGMAGEERRIAEIILRNAEVQRRLIEDALDTERLALGKMRIELQPVPLRTLLEGAVESARPAAALKDISIATRIEASPIVAADPLRLQQVLSNLLGNALKFSPRGHRVVVRAAIVDSDAVLEVADQGVGIERELLPTIFDLHRQGDGGVARNEGLGLGLALAQDLVRLHGGRIEAESDGPGCGALFRITLPAIVDPAPRPSTPDGQTRLLLMKEAGEEREALRIELERLGLDVMVGGSPSDALEQLGRQRVDVILCDVDHGSEGSTSLIRELRDRANQVGGWLPAIAWSSSTDSDAVRKALAEGFTTLLGKESGPEAIAQMVGRLRRRRLPT